MAYSIFLLAASLISSEAAAEPEAPSAPAAVQLFEQDWLLMNWALRNFDADKDVVLSPEEAAEAALEFKRIADADTDGRVTPDEFRRGRDFILARY